MISEKSVTDFFIQSLLTQRHSSLATCSVYRYEINCFFDYLKHKNLDFKTISSSEIDDYLIENAKKRKISSSTSSRVITVLKLFFSFALEHNWRKDDPTELTGDVKHAKKLPSVLQENQIEKFLSSIDITCNTGKRDRAMFELIYSCGLRVSECCNLKIKDYFPEEKRIVVTGKGNKQRMIPVGEYAIDAIQEYFEESRPQLLNHKKSDYVFISNKKKGITRQEVWVRLKHYAKIADLDLKVHTLRHSFASQLLRNGADLKSIQEFLGHSDIKTTEIYTHVNTEDLYQAFKKSHPLQTDKKQQV